MKKCRFWAAIISIVLLLTVAVGAFYIIEIPAPSEEPLIGFCHWCQDKHEYTVGYEKWTKQQHCIRHWCVECGYDQLAGCAAEKHAMVLNWCWKCGWPDRDELWVLWRTEN